MSERHRVDGLSLGDAALSRVQLPDGAVSAACGATVLLQSRDLRRELSFDVIELISKLSDSVVPSLKLINVDLINHAFDVKHAVLLLLLYSLHVSESRNIIAALRSNGGFLSF
jgi:hypothetical protein